MDIDRIEALVQLVSQSSVSEVTVRTEDRRITVRRSPAGPAARVAASRRRETPAAGQALTVTMDGHGAPSPAGMEWVTSPLVGIFYHSEPPVSLGVEVKPGQVIGVIESMKLMNEVRSDHGGVVVESAIEAGMAVEYGQPLFAVRAAQMDAEMEADDGGTT